MAPPRLRLLRPRSEPADARIRPRQGSPQRPRSRVCRGRHARPRSGSRPVRACLCDAGVVDNGRSNRELLDHLDRIADLLAPGGLYLLDSVVWFRILHDYRRSWTRRRGGIEVRTRYRAEILDPIAQTYNETLSFAVDDRGRKLTIEGRVPVKMFFPQEFRSLIEQSARFEFIGRQQRFQPDRAADTRGPPYRHPAQPLIWHYLAIGDIVGSFTKGSEMAVPDFQSLMLPVLIATSGGEISAPNFRDRVAATVNFNEEDLKEMLPSGRQTTFSNRTAWANVFLQRAGLIEKTGRGIYRATETGNQVLAKKPTKIDMPFLERFPSYVEWRQRSAAGGFAKLDRKDGGSAIGDVSVTPEELMEKLRDLDGST